MLGSQRRNRLVCAVLTALVIALGIDSRRLGYRSPRFVTADLGDILYTVEAFLAVGFVRPRWASGVVGAAA